MNEPQYHTENSGNWRDRLTSLLCIKIRFSLESISWQLLCLQHSAFLVCLTWHGRVWMFHQHKDCILFRRFTIDLQSRCMHEQTIGYRLWVTWLVRKSLIMTCTCTILVKYTTRNYPSQYPSQYQWLQNFISYAGSIKKFSCLIHTQADLSTYKVSVHKHLFPLGWLKTVSRT